MLLVYIFNLSSYLQSISIQNKVFNDNQGKPIAKTRGLKPDNYGNYGEDISAVSQSINVAQSMLALQHSRNQNLELVPVSKSLSICQGQMANKQLFHRGSIGSILDSSSVNVGVLNRPSNRKSLINEEKIMKVASVYAIGSLSPVLKRHLRNQLGQHNSRVRDLSNPSGQARNVGLSLSNVKLPQLGNRVGIHDLNTDQQYQPYENNRDSITLAPQIVASQASLIKKSHASINRSYINNQANNNIETPYQQPEAQSMFKKKSLVAAGEQLRKKKERSSVVQVPSLQHSESGGNLLQVNFKQVDEGFINPSMSSAGQSSELQNTIQN